MKGRFNAINSTIYSLQSHYKGFEQTFKKIHCKQQLQTIIKELIPIKIYSLLSENSFLAVLISYYPRYYPN